MEQKKATRLIARARRGAAPADPATWPVVSVIIASRDPAVLLGPRLIDALAPVRAPVRPGAATPAVQCHRLPRGCVLQGATSAVSVSWFAAAPSENSLGELQVSAWRGTVSLPGSAVRRSGAMLVTEKVLVPVEGNVGEWRWQGDDVVWTTDELVAHCHGVLGEPTPA